MTNPTNSASRRLGRGLASMLAQPVAIVDIEQTANMSGGLGGAVVEALSLVAIHPNAGQPRKVFDQDALQRLAESIRVAGVIQPVLVRKSGGGQDSYELIAGERRWRAAKIAGLERIPAIVAHVSDAQSAEWALIENIQREDLNAMERAWALRHLMDRFGVSAAELAERIGLDRSTVVNFIRLTELESSIQRLIEDQRLTGGHGKALLAAPAGDDRVALARAAVEQKWSVRRTELEAARCVKARPAPGGAGAGERTAAVIEDLQRQLGAHLGTKVHISARRGGTRGRIVIEYYDLDHFDALMTKIGFRTS
jgi:ParB family chromosome partitioning protein